MAMIQTRPGIDSYPPAAAYVLGWEECVAQRQADEEAAQDAVPSRCQDDLRALVERIYQIAPYPPLPDAAERPDPPPVWDDEGAIARETRIEEENEALALVNDGWRPLT